ncbi:MAG: hypothetical protein IH830_03600 [Planctomycetes bacterium]|nr:hypothetical protein [Planctomycetota bacterium]
MDQNAPGGPGDPGATWQNAYIHLQDALAFASDPLNGITQVWVAAGTYHPDECDACGLGGSDDRTATFNLINNVGIYGGFLGNAFPGGGETELSQRDPEANETILSGDINPLQPVDPPPACADPDPGAGNCFTPTPGIPGCTDPACCEVVCAFPGGGFQYCCDIQWDTFCTDIANGLCSTKAYHVVNAGAAAGPGVDETSRLDGFTITSGHANGGANESRGGGMLAQLSQPVLIRCKFQGNLASEGGAVYNQGDCMGCPGVGLRMINCSFIDNSATGDGGGAIFNHSANRSLLVNCLFVDNFALGADGGGAILNSANPGPSSPVFINCTFTRNSADIGIGGGILDDDEASAEVINCILWGNSDSSGSGQSAQISWNPPAIPDVSYTCIEGLEPGGPFDGNGNIGDDPLFVNPASDFHLQAGSLCINAGNPDEDVIPDDEFDVNEDMDIMEPTPDLDLHIRVVPAPPLGIVDMGAYELCKLGPCPWDLDGDGMVGILDLLNLLAAWGTDPGGPPDVNCDGDVDVFDLKALADNWGRCPETTGQPPKSLKKELDDAGLSEDDWDLFKDCLTNGTPEEQDNCRCWFDRYLIGCPADCSQLPACGDVDPFNECPGDFTGPLGVPDCTVDAFDQARLLACWGMPCGDLTGDCTTDPFDLSRLLNNWGACPQAPLCGPGPELTCDECAQGDGGSGSSSSLTAALDEMGFDSVDEYQDWLIDASDSEAFASASLLLALLEGQP